MHRLARWLRIGLACTMLWASAAAVTAPVARAESHCVAFATRSERTSAADSRRHARRQPPAARPEKPSDRRCREREMFPARALLREKAARLYLRHCVLLR